MGVRQRNRLATTVLIILLLALPLAAVIQTNWLNAASRAEAQRLERSLDNAFRQIRSDLLFELTSITRLLPPALTHSDAGDNLGFDVFSENFTQLYDAWSDSSRFPGLVEQVRYVGPLTEREPYDYNPKSGRFIRANDGDAWDQSDPLVLFVPLDRAVEIVERQSDGVQIQIVDPGHLLIRLDRIYLAGSVLPELVETYLGADAGDYNVAVVDFEASEILWSDFEAVGSMFDDERQFQPDSVLAMSPRSTAFSELTRSDRLDDVPPAFSERLADPLIQQWLSFRLDGDRVVPPDGVREPPNMADRIGENRETGPGLYLVAWHRAGSIDAAARTGRNRNLILSYGALGLVMGATVAYYLLYRRANRQREREQEFVATVTHELRTPVSAITAAGDNLAEGIVSDQSKVRQYGRSLLGEGRRLGTMIDQVLLYAGLGGGARPKVEVDVKEIVGAATRSTSGARPGHLIVHAQDQLPPLRGDRVAVESVIRNLVSNAFVHNPSSTTVTLRVHTESREARRGRRHSPPGSETLVIEVSDTGRGIPRREIQKIREPFYRGEQSQADQIPGSGLGLSLVSRIAATYDGSVTIRSDEGKGTTVTVKLRFERGDDRAT